MDKYLITGFSGFVAKHFLNYLRIVILHNYLYRTRDYAFFISAMGKLFVTLFAGT